MVLPSPPGAPGADPATGPTLVLLEKALPIRLMRPDNVVNDTTSNPMPTRGFNSAIIDLSPGPTAGPTSATLLGAPTPGGPWLAEVDPNSFQSGLAASGAHRFVVTGISGWVALALTAPVGWTAWITLYNAAAQTTINVTGTTQSNIAQVAGIAIGAGNPVPTHEQGTAGTNIQQVGGAGITLGAKTSANSLPVVVASDQSVVTMQPIHPAATTGTFTSGSTAGTSVVGPVSMQNLGSAIISVHGVYGAGLNLAFEADDGSGTWYPVQAVRSDSFFAETSSGALAANQARAWELDLGGFVNLRVRDLANPASGTATITIIPTAESADPAVAAGLTNGLQQLDATTANLAANGIYTGAWQSTAGYGQLSATGASAQAGTVYIDQSPDGVNSDATSANSAVAAGSGTSVTTPVVAPYARLRYVNGAAAQTSMRAYLFGKRV